MAFSSNSITLSWSFRTIIGIPFASVNIDYFYTESERMQVLTEYVLRLLKIIEQAPASAIRFYLGLSNNEMKVLVNDLLDKHYIRQTIDGDLSLNELITDRLFIKNKDDQLIPRLSKLLDARKFITVVYVANRYLLLNNAIKSDQAEIVENSLYDLKKVPSLDEIGETFQNQFDSITIENEKRLSLHSVTKIRMNASGLYAVPVKLEIDTSGNLNFDVESRDKNKTLNVSLLPEVTKSIHWEPSIKSSMESSNPGFLLWLKLFPQLFQGLDVAKKSFSDLVNLIVDNGSSLDGVTVNVGENLANYIEPKDFLDQTNIGFFLQNILTSKSDEVIWKPATFQSFNDKEEKIHQREYEISKTLLKSLSEPTRTKISFKLLEVVGKIPEQPEHLAIFAQIFNQPQSSLILVKGKAVICTYYYSIGKLQGQSERSLYVPVTVCCTNKQLILTIENLLNSPSQKNATSSSLEESSADGSKITQTQTTPFLKEVLGQPTGVGNDKQRVEFKQMVKEMKHRKFKSSGRLAQFISQYKLEKRYPHLIESLEITNGEDIRYHVKGLSPECYAKLCEALGWSNEENESWILQFPDIVEKLLETAPEPDDVEKLLEKAPVHI